MRNTLTVRFRSGSHHQSQPLRLTDETHAHVLEMCVRSQDFAKPKFAHDDKAGEIGE